MPGMANVVSLIDHAVLHPTQTSDDVRAACEMAARLGIASVCVKPSHVALAANALRGSGVAPSTVIGFPHGGTTSAAKVAETLRACDDGAVEVDMVINIGQALSGEWESVGNDIASVVAAAKSKGAITKVIFETGLMPSDEHKRKLCELSEAAGAAFVKTSTGFGFVKGPDGALVSTGATVEDIRLMRAACGPNVQVKASGGVRSYDDAVRLVEAGATRLGTSATEAIAKGAEGDSY
ncbi:Deoxyribose-phosphate aldolase 2 [Botrimarina colliarenosi]|uniref:Deoxyribose-phosphate aldolase n=1 Tax=Botrimarina colliarenosi TaxID=2528001 RepID=A0A5C6ABJ0_9BACT|nr:deoxyribose-phosphate aldolase [Botrimarina colliarenosi]TWT96959.1 Deoxyribose-phosphate aldolase 2 [Botrimarina colliarenosi]